MSYTLASLLLLAAFPAAGNALHTEIEAIRAAKDSPFKDTESSFLLPVDRTGIDLDFLPAGRISHLWTLAPDRCAQAYLKQPWSASATYLVLSPLEPIEELAALVSSLQRWLRPALSRRRSTCRLLAVLCTPALIGR